MQPHTSSSKELPECLILHEFKKTCVEVKSYSREPCGQMKNLSDKPMLVCSAAPSAPPCFHMNLSCFRVLASFLGSSRIGYSISQESLELIVWEILEASLFIAVTWISWKVTLHIRPASLVGPLSQPYSGRSSSWCLSLDTCGAALAIRSGLSSVEPGSCHWW